MLRNLKTSEGSLSKTKGRDFLKRKEFKKQKVCCRKWVEFRVTKGRDCLKREEF